MRCHRSRSWRCRTNGWRRSSGLPATSTSRREGYSRSAASGEPALADTPTETLRARLLAVHGIGPETADDILLYAFERPVFVIDAYTRRLFGRLGLASGHESYEELRTGVERAIGPDPASLNELHALIVHHAKVACAKVPRCAGCCLREICPSGGLPSRA